MQSLQPGTQCCFPPKIPPPVRVLRETGASDCFLTADHAGRVIPQHWATWRIGGGSQRHIAWDIGIAGVTELCRLCSTPPRYCRPIPAWSIDCNRNPSWPSAMPEVSEYTAIPGNRTSRTRQGGAGCRHFHALPRPHPRVLDARTGRTVLVAMHSFTPSFKGENRAMQVGLLYNKDPRLARILLDLLDRNASWSLATMPRTQSPTDSDYGVPTHGENAACRTSRLKSART